MYLCMQREVAVTIDEHIEFKMRLRFPWKCQNKD